MQRASRLWKVSISVFPTRYSCRPIHCSLLKALSVSKHTTGRGLHKRTVLWMAAMKGSLASDIHCLGEGMMHDPMAYFPPGQGCKVADIHKIERRSVSGDHHHGYYLHLNGEFRPHNNKRNVTFASLLAPVVLRAVTRSSWFDFHASHLFGFHANALFFCLLTHGTTHAYLRAHARLPA